MVEQQYFPPGLADSDDLSGTATIHGRIPTTTAPTTAAYPELTSYGAVSTSPFSLPSGPCDSNLLTPISGAESPPLHQASKFGQYQGETTPVQQPTPPGGTRMYHQSWAQFDMNGGQTSQSSSPMANPAPVSHEFLETSYMEDGRRTPGPPEPYMGAFGVSEGTGPPPMNQPYYIGVPPVEHQQHSVMMRDDRSIPIAMHQQHELPPAPILGNPRSHRRSSAEGHVLHGLPEDPRSITGSPRRAPARARRSRQSRSSRSGRSGTSMAQDNTVNDYKNCFGQEVPPKLKPSCPDEERCLFESRWQHRHKKGQDMWESIQNDFNTRFGKHNHKEMLQMKLKRGRAKYIEWEPTDVERLRDAWMRVEKERYEQIRLAFLDLGGSRNMQVSASDIEVKVVQDLKLEENVFVDSFGDGIYIRRRLKSSTNQRQPAGVQTGPDNMMSGEEMLASAREDEIIAQVHNARPELLDDGSPSVPNEMMDMNIWQPPVKIEPGLLQAREENLPIQNCDPMMRLSPGSQGTLYGQRKGP